MISSGYLEDDLNAAALFVYACYRQGNSLSALIYAKYDKLTGLCLLCY